jgi:uncharacterized Ntn-hydrolase superfamily protein
MTFTIVARCRKTGDFGLAVASASLAVGARCPHVRSSTGAVTTQARTDPTLGPRVLDLLQAGQDAASALNLVVGFAAFSEWRQLAVVDKAGRIATHHGTRCAGLVGEARGEGCVALGNLLASPDVPAAMIAAFEASPGHSLEQRLLAALQAGLSAGGETRPLRSAALLVVAEDPFPRTNLRIDHHEDPMSALQALHDQWWQEAGTIRLWALNPGGA